MGRRSVLSQEALVRKLLGASHELDMYATLRSWFDSCGSGAPRKAAAVLSRLAGRNRPDFSLSVLRWLGTTGMELDVSQFNAVITSCKSHGEWATALGLLADMARRRVVPNTITYEEAMQTCQNGGAWEKSLKLLAEMPWRSDATTYDSAISACTDGGEWEKALELMAEMFRRRVKQRASTYSNAIYAYNFRGEWEKALELVAEMALRRVEHNSETILNAMHACSTGGKWRLALQFFMEPALHERRRGRYTAVLDAVYQQFAGRILFQKALDDNVFNTDLVILDFHAHSPAVAALLLRRWLLKSASQATIKGNLVLTVPMQFQIGWGRHRQEGSHSMNVKQAVSCELNRIGVPWSFLDISFAATKACKML